MTAYQIRMALAVLGIESSITDDFITFRTTVTTIKMSVVRKHTYYEYHTLTRAFMVSGVLTVTFISDEQFIQFIQKKFTK
jgi:hypothetical protein